MLKIIIYKNNLKKNTKRKTDRGLTDACLFYVSILHSIGIQCDIHAIDHVSGGTYEHVSNLMFYILRQILTHTDMLIHKKNSYQLGLVI